MGFIVFGILTGLLIFIAILLVFFVIIFGIILRYRKLRTISPTILLLVLFSIIIGYISVFAWFGKPHPVSCAFQPWLLGLPALSMIIALSVKIFRIWKIFNDKMNKNIMSDWKLIILWFLLMLPAILIVLLWTIISTPTAKMTEVHDGKDHYILDLMDSLVKLEDMYSLDY